MRKLKAAAAILVVAGWAALSYFYHLPAEIHWSLRYLLTSESPPPEKMQQPLPKCPGCNVIFISLDTLRADRLGFQGSTLKLTPNFDKIAARSTVFTHAFTNAFFTTPSHMTMFTSLYPNTHLVEGRDVKLMRNPRTSQTGHILDAQFTTLAEVFKAQGYKTYWNAPLHLNFLEFSDGFSRGFENFAPSPFDRGLDFKPDHSSSFISESLAPLKLKQKSFLFLHSYITHHPYIWRDEPYPSTRLYYSKTEVLQDFKNAITTEPATLPHMLSKVPLTIKEETELGQVCTNFQNMDACFAKWTTPDRFWHATGQLQVRRATGFFRDVTRDRETWDHEMETYKHAYANGVRFLDRQIGQFWEALEKTGALDHTIVVLVSDHGEELFDNGEPSHSSFYDHTARVPMVIYHPKLAEGQRIDQLVSLVDIMPMVLAMVDIPPPNQTQGTLPWQMPAKYVFGYALGNEYVRSWTWKLIRTYDGQEQLYYLPLDPLEQRNLIEFRNPWTTQAYRQLAQARRDWEIDQSLAGGHTQGSHEAHSPEHH